MTNDQFRLLKNGDIIRNGSNGFKRGITHVIKDMQGFAEAVCYQKTNGLIQTIQAKDAMFWILSSTSAQ